MHKSLISSCIAAAVALAISNTAQAHYDVRHEGWVHNYTSQNIQIGGSTFKDQSNFDFHDNQNDWKSIPINTSGNTWGDNEDKMPSFHVSHHGSGTKDITSNVRIYSGSKKNGKGDYVFYQLGKIDWYMVDGDSLNVMVKMTTSDTDNVNGLYVNQVQKMTHHGSDGYGHIAIHKTTIEANHFYVCVYSPGATDVDYQVGLNKSGFFNSKLVNGSSATLFTNNQQTLPGSFQTTNKTIHFGEDGKSIECTPDLGSFAVNGNYARQQANLISVQVKNLSSGDAHSTDIGEPIPTISTSSSSDPTDNSDVVKIDVENGEQGKWNVSKSPSISGNTSLDCPGGFCFSGDPDGNNSVYLIYRDDV